jgi:hypothetical protein
VPMTPRQSARSAMSGLELGILTRRNLPFGSQIWRRGPGRVLSHKDCCSGRRPGGALIDPAHRSATGEALLCEAKDLLCALLFGDSDDAVRLTRISRELLTLTLPEGKAHVLTDILGPPRSSTRPAPGAIRLGTQMRGVLLTCRSRSNMARRPTN